MVYDEDFRENGDLEAFRVSSGSAFHGSFPFIAKVVRRCVRIEIENGHSEYTLYEVKEIYEQLGLLIRTAEGMKKNGARPALNRSEIIDIKNE